MGAVDWDHLLFTDQDLKKLLWPLIAEQLLNSLMGMMDTMMVSRVGSAAISAVSLVDAINTLFIQIFAAMATGGTILCSQYLGQETENRVTALHSRLRSVHLSLRLPVQFSALPSAVRCCGLHSDRSSLWSCRIRLIISCSRRRLIPSSGCSKWARHSIGRAATAGSR